MKQWAEVELGGKGGRCTDRIVSCGLLRRSAFLALGLPRSGLQVKRTRSIGLVCVSEGVPDGCLSARLGIGHQIWTKRV